jgi:octaheme c-type cytochrome (tetrathionate reductase family)
MKAQTIALILLLVCVPLVAQEDHSEFIEGPFSSPQEVTETCLMCHDGVAQDIMLTSHWTWLGKEFVNETGLKTSVGKQNIINNYCISLSSNWARCTSCHIGYGWKDESFDFSNVNNIDCLICHDQTGTYKKSPTGAGLPDPAVDLVKVAQNVGRTSNVNCGACHFYGGGGNGVKHGDLNTSMANPSAELDVHMGGAGLTCSDCHAGENHQILGASHGSLATGSNHINCMDCHGEDPHAKKVLNTHVSSLACETCHIPTFARELPTLTWWDWSAAGQNREPKTDAYGMPLYDKKKGEYKWEKDVVPEYRWHNGKAEYYQVGDQFDPYSKVQINTLPGSKEDPAAKITPFKVMRGKQIYDSENNYLITPKLSSQEGFWTTYDWGQAAELGMAESEQAYSGKYGFIETEMYWPVNHMVAPAKKSLKCADCHTRKEKKRLDWKALGYDDDPMRAGGRN